MKRSVKKPVQIEIAFRARSKRISILDCEVFKLMSGFINFFKILDFDKRFNFEKSNDAYHHAMEVMLGDKTLKGKMLL